MTRNSNLDAVRGLSILSVMMYHFFLPYGQYLNESGALAKLIHHFCNMGWLGVDVFFVLSGYLITSILNETKAASNYFTAFYLRRVCRIVPLYYLALVLSLFMFPLLMPSLLDAGFGRIWSNQAWLWTYTSNIPSSFIDRSLFVSGTIALIHFWSLAIEEQFYIFWPHVIKRTNARSGAKVCWSLISLSLLTRASFEGVGIDHNASYAFTLSRLDSLCMGALVAFGTLRDNSSWGDLFTSNLFRNAVKLGGMGTLVVLFLDGNAHKESAFVRLFGYTILACFFALILRRLLTVSVPPNRLVTTTMRFLTFTGEVSYGLYVWHLLFYPLLTRVFSVSRIERLGLDHLQAILVQVVALTLASYAVAYCSLLLFERRFYALRPAYRSERGPARRDGVRRRRCI